MAESGDVKRRDDECSVCSFEGANIVKIEYSSLAQLVERAAVNRVVAGSSPAGGAREARGMEVLRVFVIFWSITSCCRGR